MKILYEPITQIEYLGSLQVYDIEVEGTHNFVAQGIVAHNTYVKGIVQRAKGIEEEKSASSAVGRVADIASNAGLEEVKELGGIDLSTIDLTLKDEKYISSLNPADKQILLAAKYFKDGWESF